MLVTVVRQSTSADDSSPSQAHPLTDKSLRLDLDMGIASGDRRVYDFSFVGTGSVTYDSARSKADPVARMKLSFYLFPSKSWKTR